MPLVRSPPGAWFGSREERERAGLGVRPARQPGAPTRLSDGARLGWWNFAWEVSIVGLRTHRTRLSDGARGYQPHHPLRAHQSVPFISLWRSRWLLEPKNVFHDAAFFFMLLAFSRTSTALAGGGLSPRG